MRVGTHTRAAGASPTTRRRCCDERRGNGRATTASRPAADRHRPAGGRVALAPGAVASAGWPGRPAAHRAVRVGRCRRTAAARPASSTSWWTAPATRPCCSSWCCLLGAALVTGVLTAVSNRLRDQLGLTLAADLRESAIDKALRIDAATLEQAGTGDVTSRVTEDVELINASVKVTAGVFTALVTVVFTVVGFVSLDWRLALAFLLVFVVHAFGLRRFLRRAGSAVRRRPSRRREPYPGAVERPARRPDRPRVRDGGAAEPASSTRPRPTAIATSLAANRAFFSFTSTMNIAEAVGLSSLLITGFFLVRADQVTVGAVTAAALVVPAVVRSARAAAVLLQRGAGGGCGAHPAGRCGADAGHARRTGATPPILGAPDRPRRTARLSRRSRGPARCGRRGARGHVAGRGRRERRREDDTGGDPRWRLSRCRRNGRRRRRRRSTRSIRSRCGGGSAWSRRTSTSSPARCATT